MFSMLPGGFDNTLQDIVDHEEVVNSNDTRDETDESESTSSHENETSESEEEELGEELISMLSEASRLAKPKCNQVHSTIANVWFSVMTTGLESNIKERLLKEYIREGRISFEAPAMNPEVLAAVNTTVKARDKHLVNSQNEIGSALSALGLAIRTLSSEKGQEKMTKTSQHLIDTGAILSEHFYRLSLTRKAFITPTISDKAVVAILEETKPGLLLFGDDLGSKLRAAKIILKTGQEFLAPKPRKTFETTKPGNSRRPSYQGQQSGRRRDPTKSYKSTGKSSFKTPSHHQDSQRRGSSKSKQRRA